MKKDYFISFNGLKKSLIRVGVFFVFFILIISNDAFSAINPSFKEDSLLMAQYQKLGREAGMMGDFESSIDYLNKSLVIGKKIYGQNNLGIFASLINIGIVYKNIGEYEKAKKSYLAAEKVILNRYGSQDNPRLGYAYTNMGTVYKLEGDYVKSHEFQNAALRVLLTDSVRFANQVVNARYNVAEALYFLKRFDEAISIANENIPLVDSDRKSFYYSLLGEIYSEMKEYEIARKYYLETLKILKELYGEDDYGLGQEYANYSTFLLQIKDFDDALAYNHLAEPIIEKYYTKKSMQYSDVMLNYADYLFSRSSAASGVQDFSAKRKQDLEKAQDYYQRAIVAATQEFDSEDIYDIPTHNEAITEVQLLKIVKKKALCFETLADLNMSVFNKDEALMNYKAALASMELATELIHQIRTGFVSEESRFFLAENQDATFIEAVNIAYKLYSLTGEQEYAEKGFELAEKSKSASFLAAVKDSKAKEFGGVPDSLLSQEDYFKINISNYREMLFEENQNPKPDSAKLALYNSKIFQFNERYNQLIELLEDSFPNYYSFKYENKVIDIEDVKMNISDRDALVEFLIEEPTLEKPNGKIFKFVITRDEVQFVANNVEPDFVENIEYLYGFLSSPNYLSTGLNEFKGYVQSAYNLYSVLLGSESKVLEGKQLIVVPDDKLAYIPFDAMLTELPDTTRMNFRKLSYLVKDYSISYTYSATLLFNFFENEKQAKNDLLAFAPVYTSDKIHDSGEDEERSRLLPIPAVDQEVESIGDYVSTDVYRDSFAQEGIFKELAPHYDILHLSMHTIINDTLPMFSKLAFSSPNSGDNDDGWLNTNEIYTMDLNARMAVLSACNTGSGQLQKGEGVMSLARGFLYAGCPSIVMTLWEVEDESGAYIMSDFYRLLSKGKSKNDALRLAKLEHIEKADPLKAHPHYWLGYVAVGNPDPLYFGKDIYFILVIFGFLVLFLIDQIYRKRKAR